MKAEKKPRITGYEGQPEAVAAAHQIMSVNDLSGQAFKAMVTLRSQKSRSPASVSKARGDLVMILNKVSYDLGGLYYMFCRDPEAFNNNPDLKYTHRPSRYQNLYQMALEYCSRFSTSGNRFDIDLMSSRFHRFEKVYNEFWAKKGKTITKANREEGLRKVRKPIEYRGVRVTQLGESICRFAPVSAHKTDAEFLTDVLGKRWSDYIDVSDFKLYYFSVSKTLEPTVTEEITWEETE
jgi:hypothetical protein